MKYNLSALEILNFWGYSESVGKQSLTSFENIYSMTLPKVYRDFMEIAHSCPLIKTSDIWDTVDSLFWYYDNLSELIVDYSDEWEEYAESYENDELYQISKLRMEKWNEKVPNYLEFGSDYGAGIVVFGISSNDISKNDSPIFWHFEDDPIAVWKDDPNNDKISDFLLDELLNSLNLTNYNTAKRELDNIGWQHSELTLKAKFEDCIKTEKIDLTQIKKFGRRNYDIVTCFVAVKKKTILFMLDKLLMKMTKMINLFYIKSIVINKI